MDQATTGNLKLNLDRYKAHIESSILMRETGKVTHVTGFLLRGTLPGAAVGSICRIHSSINKKNLLAEVIGFSEKSVLLMPLGDMDGVGLGSQIILEKPMATIRIGQSLLGRVLDGMGRPIDGGGGLDTLDEVGIYQPIRDPLARKTISEPLEIGIRAIDGLVTFGKGQRVGIMAGSGVGKSVLMGMIAHNTRADVNVIALIGERGREVREFIEDVLGEEGLKRSVVVVATSDQSPLLRMRGAFVAASIAEYFCGQGADVLLMMDSVTRFAMAQREVGLNAGEPPASKGYTPSVFSLLPKIFERCGKFENQGSITGLYTVLVEGDDLDDPVADSVRSLVDGHVVLSRSLAEKGHFPAIDVLKSTSRVMRRVLPESAIRLSIRLREMLATYQQAEDLINIGAYKSGSNAQIDEAIQLKPHIDQFLKQNIGDGTGLQDTLSALQRLVG